MRIRRDIAALLVSLVVPDVARAQIAAVYNLLDRVQDVSVYPVFPVSRTANNHSLIGYGFEFSFRISEWKESLSLAQRQARCSRINAGVPGSCTPDNTADTTLTIASIRRSGTLAETTFTVSVKELEYTKWLFELAVASQSTNLRGTGIVPGWRLSGRIQEWPIFSGYATYRPARKLAPYVGGSYIQGDLNSVRIAQGDSAATVEASAHGGAVSAGAVWSVKGFGVFGEATYTILRFDTHNWLRPLNFPTNAVLPSRLELSGLSLRIGVQLPLSESEK